MKDALLLLLAGALFATLAWAFWNYLGDDAFSAIAAVAVMVLSWDNARLRKELYASKDDTGAR